MDLFNNSLVYIDTCEIPFGKMLMCHMASPDLEALHAMAQSIGIDRKWFQDTGTGKFKHPHYDVCKSYREKAIKKGAILVDPRTLIKKCYPEMHFALNKDKDHD